MEVSLQSFRKRFTYDPTKDLLGKGGFSEVYKAYDNEDHHFVALKISQGTADDKYNLINEIKRFKKISHPNIVKHIEAYEVNTGSTDIHGKPILYHVGILEYADRGTLADLLKKGTPDYRIIEDLAKDIIEGLAYLHTNNIIHRDLKPSNILLFSEGEKLRAKITDFGIAKNTDATAASTQLVGTVEYMAPEYFTTGHITPASDVWSLGLMLLEALTGTHPFGKTTQGASNEQIIANILNKDISTATANLTEPLKKIITDCLRREPVLRPQSADALKAELANPTADAFTEKTQVIELKKPTAKTQSTEPKWKRLGKALFDFDVSNGKWRKVLAREFLITLPFIPFLIRGIQVGEDLGYITLAALPFLRYIMALFIWSFRTLEIQIPAVSVPLKKTIKRSLLVILAVSLLSGLILFGIYQYRTLVEVKHTSDSDLNKTPLKKESSPPPPERVTPKQSTELIDDGIKNKDSKIQDSERPKAITSSPNTSSNSTSESSSNQIISLEKRAAANQLVLAIVKHLPCSVEFNYGVHYQTQDVNVTTVNLASVDGSFLTFTAWVNGKPFPSKFSLRSLKVSISNIDGNKADIVFNDRTTLTLCNIDAYSHSELNQIIERFNTIK